MSEEIRTAIADAANAVDGINVAPYFRQTTKPGDGMVRFDRMNRDDTGLGFMSTWQVIVVIPPDVAAAERYLEQIVPELLEALRPVLIITSVTPQRLQPDGATEIKCVFIEGVL